MRRHHAMAIASLGLLGSGACHSILLGSVTVTPAPGVATPAVALEVKRVGLSVLECAHLVDTCARAHLAVGVEAVNHGAAPVTVAADEATLAIGDRSVDVRASGVGPLIGEIDDRSDAGAVVVGPGERQQLWVDFTNLPYGEAATGARSRVAVAIPVAAAHGSPARAEFVLADPGKSEPRWHRETPNIPSLSLGGVWMNAPVPATAGAGRTHHDIFGLQFAASGSRAGWFARYTASYVVLTHGEGRDAGYAFGGQIGKTYSIATNRGAWLSWAPTAGVQLAYLFNQPPPGQLEDETALVGVSAGISLFVDRDRAIGGPLPIEPLRPRHGSMVAVQLLYVHWFGHVFDVPLGWSGAGFIANVSMGLNSP